MFLGHPNIYSLYQEQTTRGAFHIGTKPDCGVKLTLWKELILRKFYEIKAWLLRLKYSLVS
jgi:hypothetical protein